MPRWEEAGRIGPLTEKEEEEARELIREIEQQREQAGPEVER